MTMISPVRITASKDAVIRTGVFGLFWCFYKCAVSIDTVDPAIGIAGRHASVLG